MAYSTDVKLRAIAYAEEGHTLAQMAKVFNVHTEYQLLEKQIGPFKNLTELLEMPKYKVTGTVAPLM